MARGLAYAAVLAVVALSPALAGEIVRREGSIEGRYLVLFREGVGATPGAGPTQGMTASRVAEDMAAVYGGRVVGVLQQALSGGVLEMSESDAKRLADDWRVARVEQDWPIPADAGGTRVHPWWGLDRVDERSLPWNDHYVFQRGGYGVNIYMLDTGVANPVAQLGSRLVNAFSTVTDGQGTPVFGDPTNHGSVGARMAAGNPDGVAPGATVHAVRIAPMPCGGSGCPPGGGNLCNPPAKGLVSSSCFSYCATLLAIDWVKDNHQTPAVANLSFGSIGEAPAVAEAVQSLVASGVTVTVAAGNENADACSKTPARLPEVITVGASDNQDRRASFSNWGSCVDLFAPGENVGSFADPPSGTSFAAPMVAGAAAQYLQLNRQASPAAVKSYILSNTTRGALTAVSGSPNRLLFTPPGGPEVDNPPSADFTYDCVPVGASFDCSFTSTSTDDFGIASCTWELEQGAPPVGPACSTTRSYTDPDGVGVTLTVLDDTFHFDQITKILSAAGGGGGGGGGGGPEAVTFHPSADAFVRQDLPDTNFGVGNSLRVRSSETGQAKHSFLRFYVSGVSAPVISAKLRLRVRSNPIDGIWIHRTCSAAWLETQLTWNNWEALTGGSCGLVGLQRDLDPQTWYELDLSGVVSGNGHYSFAVVSWTDNNVQRNLNSRESIDPPELVVTYEP